MALLLGSNSFADVAIAPLLGFWETKSSPNTARYNIGDSVYIYTKRGKTLNNGCYTAPVAYADQLIVEAKLVAIKTQVAQSSLWPSRYINTAKASVTSNGTHYSVHIVLSDMTLVPFDSIDPLIKAKIEKCHQGSVHYF